jgi:formate hydrogenlyase subunit 6/NADH:ubiquinone oxidoreductase subunit I
VDNLAVIDYEKCTKCGLCVEGCPTHCLHTVNLYTNYDSAN